MKRTILIPVDFSEVAKNATKYAAGLAKILQVDTILLYHAWQLPITSNPEVPSITQETAISLEESSRELLNNFQTEVRNYVEAETEVEILLEYNQIANGINELCESREITLVVMGVTGSGKFDETFIGSHAVNTARKIIPPVLIVPNGFASSPLVDVMLSFDYKDTLGVLAVSKLRKLLNYTNAKLEVVYVDKDGKLETDATERTLYNNKTVAFTEALGMQKIDFHIIPKSDYVEAINTYAMEETIDMIIVVPKKKGFWESLFKASHTKQLAFNTVKPLLIVNQN